MKHQKYFYFGIIAILAVVAIFLIVGCTQNRTSVQNKPTTLIFQLKSNYLGNYLGAINYYNDSNTYRSFGTFELFDYCYMVSKSNDIYDDATGEKVHDEMDSEEEICFNTDSENQLKNGGVKKLSNNYYAVIVPNSEAMIKRFAIFNKSIITKAISETDRLSVVPATFPNGVKHGMGNSMEMYREEFYSYVIDKNPLIEAFFCDEPENNLNDVSRDLSNGEIPITCKQII